MELRVLRYFLAVAREENISRAAEALHTAQPSLSRQLKELEEELGKTLFLRGRRKITLTEEGMFLRKRAEEIIGLVGPGRPRECASSPEPPDALAGNIRTSISILSAATGWTSWSSWIRASSISPCWWAGRIPRNMSASTCLTGIPGAF